MDEIVLIKPTEKDEERVMDYKRECLESGEKVMHGDGGLDKFQIYANWLHSLEIESKKETCSEGRVSSSTYMAVRKSDNRVVGTIQIRHYLNEGLFNRGGHIGYEVRPSERRKGYATEMLRLALIECSNLDIKKVLVVCSKGNLGSSGTIIKCGGVLENEVLLETGEWIQRYWINL